ncbi:MAG TPA: hypothetical protein VHK05_08060 [Candidatus Limnocylindrales bacterium]|jgi:hypothetical protein|nr:hypothetical protein [Candidatus Limnocylindrales bacterium]
MGPANPWSPNWRPDPTGRRLASIRTARRGAILAAILLGTVTAIAGLLAPERADRPASVAFAIAAMAVPAFALLGAGLAPAAIGSRVDAVVVGLAMAIGAPVAAALSTAIAVVSLVAISGMSDLTGDAFGSVIRMGVVAGVRVAPLVVVAVTIWVMAVRRLEVRTPA